MANKSNAKKEKRLSYSGKGRILRKSDAWLFSTSPGPHAKSKSVNLGVLLRDVLKIADNAREVRYILSNKTVSVNGLKQKSANFPVGIFDIVSLEEFGKKYKVLCDDKGYFALRELGKQDKMVRYCKIVGKTVVKKGKFQINLDNGYNFIVDKNQYKLKDAAVFDIEKKKVLEVIPFAKGSNCYVIDGPHVGNSGEIKEIVPGDIVKREEVVVKGKNGDFRTVSEYVYVIKEL